MDLSDLKQSLRNVPGIETLTVLNLAGRLVFSLNGLIVALDPNVDQQTAEDEIRKAADARLPAVQYAEPVVAQNAPTVVSESPKAVPVQTQSRDLTVSFTGYEPGSIRSVLEEIKQHARRTREEAIQAVKIAGKQHQVVNEQLHQIAAMIKKDADDALQEFATTSNGCPS